MARRAPLKDGRAAAVDPFARKRDIFIITSLAPTNGIIVTQEMTGKEWLRDSVSSEDSYKNRCSMTSVTSPKPLLLANRTRLFVNTGVTNDLNIKQIKKDP